MQSSSQHTNIESISQIQGQSVRLNDGIQPPRTFVQRLRDSQIIKLSRKNLLKGGFLLMIILLTFWMASSFLNQTLIRGRTPFKFGTSPKDVQQIAAPDQIAYKSYYYYQKIVQLAKYNVKNDLSYKIGQEDNREFQKLDFWQLYGIFKVVKAIQLANGYQQINKDEQTQIEDTKYDSIDNLTAAVNLTSFFNKAADQARCSSCYSFPITATIEFQIAKKTGKRVKLSEQELIDCSNPDVDANGCNSGNVTRGFLYAQDTGLIQEKIYPYRSQSGVSYKCNHKLLNDSNVQKHKIKGFRELPAGNCKAIQYYLVTGNAVAAMVNVRGMQTIKNYSQPFRNCPRDQPNHAVTIVGQTQNQDWIIRNSWGQSWGNNGYFILKKGNTCGLCNYAIVPFLQDGEQLIDNNPKNH